MIQSLSVTGTQIPVLGEGRAGPSGSIFAKMACCAVKRETGKSVCVYGGVLELHKPC